MRSRDLDRRDYRFEPRKYNNFEKENKNNAVGVKGQ